MGTGYILLWKWRRAIKQGDRKHYSLCQFAPKNVTGYLKAQHRDPETGTWETYWSVIGILADLLDAPFSVIAPKPGDDVIMHECRSDISSACEVYFRRLSPVQNRIITKVRDMEAAGASIKSIVDYLDTALAAGEKIERVAQRMENAGYTLQWA